MRGLAGWMVVSCGIGWMLGCGSATVGQGGLRESCYANGSCNVGLTCLSNTCVSVSDAGASGGAGGAAGAKSATGGAAGASSAAGGAAGGGHAGGGGAAAGGAAGGGAGAGGAGGAGYPAHCSDGAQDQGESDTDCGGECAGCAEGHHCNSDADCGTALNCNPADNMCEV
jgi:hypothetical protein